MITIDNYIDCDREQIKDHTVELINKTPYGLSPDDLWTTMSRIGMNRKDFKILIDELLEDKIHLEMSLPDYRTLRGNKRRQMVYITSYKQITKKAAPIQKHEADNAAIVLKIITANTPIFEIKLKSLYKSEIKSLHGLNEAIIYLINEGKIKRNEQPKTGKIKTTYTAT